MIGSCGCLPLGTGSPVKTGVLVLHENSCPLSHKNVQFSILGVRRIQLGFGAFAWAGPCLAFLGAGSKVWRPPLPLISGLYSGESESEGSLLLSPAVGGGRGCQRDAGAGCPSPTAPHAVGLFTGSLSGLWWANEGPLLVL